MNKRNRFCNKVKTKSLTVLLAVFLLFTLVGVQFIGAVSGQWPYDWPMLGHDPQRTRHSASPAPSTNQTLWNYTTGAMIFSSPAVADGRVHVGSYDNNLYCLDAATGALLWNYTTGGVIYSSPAVANGVVYVGSMDRQIYAFSTEPPIPEGLTIGVMLLLSTIAVVIAMRYYHKRTKWKNW